MLNTYGLHIVVLQNAADILKDIIFETVYIGKTLGVPFIREDIRS